MSETTTASSGWSRQGEDVPQTRHRSRRKAAIVAESPSGTAPTTAVPNAVVGSPLRGFYAALAVLGAMAIAQLWSWHQNRSGRAFPRRESEFPPAVQLDHRLELTKQTLSLDPSDAYALKESGILHFQKGKEFYIDAINELEEARKLGAVDARIFYYLGAMYQEEGLHPFAISEYQKFLRNRPEDKETRLLLAKLLFQNGQYEDAAGQYRRLHEQDRRDGLVVENLGLSLMKAKRTEEAENIFQSLCAYGPNEARRAHFYLAQIAVEGKDYPKAKEHFSSAMPDQPELGLPMAMVYSAIAMNDERLNLPALAKERWEKTLQFDPQNAAAKKSLKTLNAALKKSAKKKRR